MGAKGGFYRFFGKTLQSEVILRQTPPEGPSRPSEDSSNVCQTTLSRVSCLRGQYQAMGIPFGITPIYKENISISLETLKWLVC